MNGEPSNKSATTESHETPIHTSRLYRRRFRLVIEFAISLLLAIIAYMSSDGYYGKTTVDQVLWVGTGISLLVSCIDLTLAILHDLMTGRAKLWAFHSAWSNCIVWLFLAWAMISFDIIAVLLVYDSTKRLTQTLNNTSLTVLLIGAISAPVLIQTWLEFRLRKSHNENRKNGR